MENLDLLVQSQGLLDRLTSRKQLGGTVRKTCAVVVFLQNGQMYFTPISRQFLGMNNNQMV
jgi:hypothetical protein